MKLYIPSLGDHLTLSKNWQFTVYSERRNGGLGNVLGLHKETENSWHGEWVGQGKGRYAWLDVVQSGSCVLPKETVLSVDRIYIRKGGKDFNSISFRIIDCPDKKFNKIRFSAKLDEVNQIEFN